ncbi:hypothetical protein BJ508DRAFT_365951 [Ascobolus immersus RN42]|uniref:Uncharacterized protein n=1 Tax=Ascobolus immersus RN42 TaxID=1160509 RepID=A0A3N4HMG6_ASCIM|nr:hypothetical protein BJ508DRAFT_365951 [Ascobolus immersus RN42]
MSPQAETDSTPGTPQIPISPYDRSFIEYNEQCMQYTTLLHLLSAELSPEDDYRSTSSAKNLSRKLDALANICISDKEVVSVQTKRLRSKMGIGKNGGRGNVANVLITRSSQEPEPHEVDRGCDVQLDGFHGEDGRYRPISEYRLRKIDRIDIQADRDIFDSFVSESWNYGQNKQFQEHLGVISELLNQSLVTEDHLEPLTDYTILSSTAKLASRFQNSEGSLNKYYLCLQRISKNEPEAIWNHVLIAKLEKEVDVDMLKLGFTALQDARYPGWTALQMKYTSEGFTVGFGFQYLLALIEQLKVKNQELALAIQYRESAKSLREKADVIYALVLALRCFYHSGWLDTLFWSAPVWIERTLGQIEEERVKRKQAESGKRPRRMAPTCLFKDIVVGCKGYLSFLSLFLP